MQRPVGVVRVTSNRYIAGRRLSGLPHRRSTESDYDLSHRALSILRPPEELAMLYPIVDLDPRDLDELIAISQREGFAMVSRLQADYVSGLNRFDQPGERLFAWIESGRWLAVGGLNIEVHPQFADAGRIRRLYVGPDHRRRGIGRALVGAIVMHGRGAFRQFTCRVGPIQARGFYERLGFLPVAAERVTHVFEPGWPDDVRTPRET
ncbi:MAG: GNAT family N-acetyltransferase [Planctomycetaceae bacterium]|nr:GNAT family N-acetyltransferase [Planctomycetaceae bacterium]